METPFGWWTPTAEVVSAGPRSRLGEHLQVRVDLGQNGSVRRLQVALTVVLVSLIAAACSTGSGPPPTSTTTTSLVVLPAAQNLVAPPGLRLLLKALYVANGSVPASMISGPLPGTLYYAYDEGTDAFYAYANFTTTPGASLEAQVSMQDGGSFGLFVRPSGSHWRFLTHGAVPMCLINLGIPVAVVAAWGIVQPTDPSCVQWPTAASNAPPPTSTLPTSTTSTSPSVTTTTSGPLRTTTTLVAPSTTTTIGGGVVTTTTTSRTGSTTTSP